MKKNILFLLSVILVSVQTGFSQNETSQEEIKARIERSRLLPVILAKSQEELALAQAASDERALAGAIIDLGANLGTRALISAIDKAEAKKTVEWEAPVSRDCFYNSPSFLGPLDPTGMQFQSITLTRDVTGPDGVKNSALFLKCSMPQDRMTEFLTNSRFCLQVDTLAIDLSKVKAKYTRKKTITVEISIQILSTWVDESLVPHEKEKLGEFHICLQKLKYNPESPVVSFGAKEADNLISGFSFFVPRSYGAYVHDGQYMKCWSAGEFETAITVKESTSGPKNKTAEYVESYLAGAIPSSVNQITTNENIVGPTVVKIIKNY